MVEIDINYTGELHTTAKHLQSGAVIETDAPVDNQGKGEAFSPTDLCASSLGVCMLTILGIVAKNNDIDLGEVKGKIVWPPKGKNGFGYDPFFVPDGYEKTFAEMVHSDKIFIDHRSIALKKLIKLHLSDS